MDAAHQYLLGSVWPLARAPVWFAARTIWMMFGRFGEVVRKMIGWVLGEQGSEAAVEGGGKGVSRVSRSALELVQQQESTGHRKVLRLTGREKLCRPRILWVDVV